MGGTLRQMYVHTCKTKAGVGGGGGGQGTRLISNSSNGLEIST